MQFASAARFLRIFLLLSAFCWGVFGFLNTWAGYSFGPYQLLACLLMLLLWVGQPRLSHSLVGNLTLMTNFSAVAINAAVTGCSRSAVIWMLVIFPHFGSFALGRMGSAVYAGLSLLGIWTLFYLGQVQIVPQSFAPDNFRFVLNQSVLLLLLWFLAWSQRRTLEIQIDLLQQREVELSSARDQAVVAMQARSRFLATMSHEIRTPLNGIVALPKMLQQCKDDREKQGLIEILESSSVHLLGIVNDILDFSRLESSAPTVRQEPVDVLDLVESVLQSSSSLPGASGLELAAHFEAGCPRRIVGDAQKLEQILRNLISNAIKFTTQGKIVVTCLAGSDLHLQVADTGPGIATEQCARVFEPFEQLADPLHREMGGTGLGLAICQRLAAAMGGELTLHSKLGEGSTFGLRLPTSVLEVEPECPPVGSDAPTLQTVGFPPDSQARLQQLAGERGWRLQQGPADRTISYPAGHSDSIRLPVTRRNFLVWLGEERPSLSDSSLATMGSGVRLLVVDDNLINRQVTRSLLVALGCQVDLACNGQEALDKVAETNYQAIFMDLHMPVMDGLTATREIRRRGQTTPVVAFTADIFPEARQEATEAGATEVLYKPVQARQLAEVIERLTRPPA